MSDLAKNLEKNSYQDRRCHYFCPQCSKQCEGIKGHDGLHQCPVHYKSTYDMNSEFSKRVNAIKNELEEKYNVILHSDFDCHVISRVDRDKEWILVDV